MPRPRPGPPLAALAVAACLASTLVTATGCYHVRIGEGFWLRARPGPGADSAAVHSGLPPGYAVRPVAVPVPGGASLAGMAATRPGAQATVLYFGGDDFLVAGQGPGVLRALAAAAPVNVVLVDYPGYGASGGAPSLAALQAGALATYDWVAGRPELAPAGVVVHGHSVGSFVAAAVADVRPVRGLVLQNSATTPGEWVRGFFRPSRLKWWARPAYPFIRVSIDPALAAEDNLARVGRYGGPLLVLSGSADREAAPSMSHALVAASGSPDSLRHLVVLPGAGHEDVLRQPGFGPAYGAFIGQVARVGAGDRR